MSPNGIIITSPSSGSGKTVVTLGILRALSKQIKIRSFKSGPDYIDPRFHEFASGSTSFNLDSWAMSKNRIFSLSSGDGPLIVEGAMGLFDGASSDGSGSAAHLSKLLDLSIVLVIDCSMMGQSIAAVVRGFITQDPDLHFLGIILNKVGSDTHLEILTDSLSDIFYPPILGALKRNNIFSHPSRQLGLVQAEERLELHSWIDQVSVEIERDIDLSSFITSNKIIPKKYKRIIPPGQNILVAKDTAFSFIYPHILEDWKLAGANVSFFSPLADEEAPPADFIYFPGGYPELYAGKLASNSKFLKSIRTASNHTRIYGECGGYMLLGSAIIDKDGKSHAMLNLLNLVTTLENPKLTLGYRKLEGLSTHIPGQFNGHEFHYAKTLHASGKSLFKASNSRKTPLDEMGLEDGFVFGSFAQLIDHDV